jgi:hypothetical protein
MVAAKNFNEYVAVMAVNSPHGLIMDSWRRLNLALREYAAAFGTISAGANARAMEEVVSLDYNLGPGIADCVRRLRVLRNQVAHEGMYHHSSEDAIRYARRAFALIGAIGKRVSCLEHPAKCP